MKDHFNEHRRPIFNPTSGCIHTVLSDHFLDSNHSDTNMLLISIEKLSNEREFFRKTCETHTIYKAKRDQL